MQVPTFEFKDHVSLAVFRCELSCGPCSCSVAHKFLDDVELGNDAIRSAVVEFMPYSFAAVNAQSKRFLEVRSVCSRMMYSSCSCVGA